MEREHITLACPKCGETEAIRIHAEYVTRAVDFYVCEACGHDWEPNKGELMTTKRMLGKREVIDERCHCRHMRSQHANRFAIGHGACTMENCLCKQFTWASFVFATRKTPRSA